jgi:glycosyltransferase involved in cell wall biosynthesis
LLPLPATCYNEAVAIGAVMRSFRAALREDIVVYVYDNNSSDGTVAMARAAGAVLRSESHKGKAMVRRMFADIDADVFVLVDGDGIYDAAAAPVLVTKLLEENLDLVNGARVPAGGEAFSPGHRVGNWFLTTLVRAIFDWQFKDIPPGYKVLSRRFVKSFPAMSTGFDLPLDTAFQALLMPHHPNRMAFRYEGGALFALHRRGNWVCQRRRSFNAPRAET